MNAFGLSRGLVLEWTAPLLVPGLLIAAVMLGGASQGNAVQAGVLQLIGAVCLIWLVLDTRLPPMPSAAIPALWLAGGFFALAGVQLIPLPPELWTRLPGREAVREGFAVFGGPLPWLPLSLAPERTLDAALALLAPLAIFVAALKLRWRHAVGSLPLVLPALAMASLALGIVQALSGEDSGFYLYANTNRGWPVGFFANVNHHASFLLICLPFVAALIGQLRQKRFAGDGVMELGVLAATLALSLVAGVLVCGSLAGYILILPVLVGSFFVAMGRGAKGPSAGAWAGVFFLLALLGAAMSTSPFVLGAGLPSIFETSGLSRPAIWKETGEALATYWSTGIGFGAFDLVFPMFEDPRTVNVSYANHAHSDWLEILLEGGVPGLALAGGLAIWWGARAAKIWTEPNSEESRLARAAVVGCAVLLLHSVVDYPLRTMASSCVGALCLAAMVAERRKPAKEKAEPSRNIAI